MTTSFLFEKTDPGVIVKDVQIEGLSWVSAMILTVFTSLTAEVRTEKVPDCCPLLIKTISPEGTTASD
jgi:hypothetical protein